MDGEAVHRLHPGRAVVGGWQQVIGLQWLVLPDAMQPLIEVEGNLYGADFSSGHKFQVSLLLSHRPGALDPPLSSGVVAWGDELRDGRRILLHHHSIELLPTDIATAEELRRAAPQPGDPDEYFETYSLTGHGTELSIVLIVPLANN